MTELTDRNELAHRANFLLMKLNAEWGRADAANILFRLISEWVQKLKPMEDIVGINSVEIIAHVFEKLADEDAALRYMNPEAARVRKVRDESRLRKVYEMVKETNLPLSEDQAFATVSESLGCLSVSSVKRHYYDYDKFLKNISEKNTEKLFHILRFVAEDAVFPEAGILDILASLGDWDKDELGDLERLKLLRSGVRADLEHMYDEHGLTESELSVEQRAKYAVLLQEGMLKEATDPTFLLRALHLDDN